MLREVWATYTGAVLESLPTMMGFAALAGLALAGIRRFGRSIPRSWAKGLELSVLLSSMAWGLYLVLTRASLFDDAFISFRYARNLLEGHGLVWNVGERVEGYTNFLWTLLVAGLSWCTRLELAQLGLWLSIAVFPVNLWLVYRLGCVLAAPLGLRLVLPVAALLVAVQDVFVTAGSTGLETGFAVLLVNGGLLRLMTARSHAANAQAGLLLILATLTRPDHALFFAAGAGVISLEGLLQLRREGRRALPHVLKTVVWFGAPSVLYLAHLAWRLSYYGEWLPNTFYAKSADRSWYSQGFVYASTFYLGSHLWVMFPVVCAWLVRRTENLPTRRFKWFTGLGLLAYNVYVVKVGGDFMYGRFYAVVVPLLSLSACQLVLELLRSPRRAARPSAYAVAMVLGASLVGVSLIPPRDIKWGIADERTFYPVSSWNPLVIDHPLFRLGKRFERMHRAGVRLRVASGAIGMIGYYSRFEVIDLLGLTDARVARQPLRERGRPGHEKWANASYLEERRPHLVRSHRYTPKEFRSLARLSFGAEAARPWFIYWYDRDTMARVAAVDAQVQFADPEPFVRRYREHVLPSRPAKERERAETFLRRYYPTTDGAAQAEGDVPRTPSAQDP